MKTILKAVMAAVICSQNTWAVQEKLQLDKVAESFKNFKTNADLIHYLKKSAPEPQLKDLESFIKDRIKPEEKVLPVTAKGNVLTITAGERMINIKVVDAAKSLAVINGVEVDLNPSRPAAEKLLRVEELLKKQYAGAGPRGFWSLVLPSAHAMTGAEAAGFGAVALAAVGFFNFFREGIQYYEISSALSGAKHVFSYCHHLEKYENGPNPNKKEFWVQNTMNRHNFVMAEWCGGPAWRVVNKVSIFSAFNGASYNKLCTVMDNVRTCLNNLIERNVQLSKSDAQVLLNRLEEIWVSSATAYDRYVHPEPKPGPKPAEAAK